MAIVMRLLVALVSAASGILTGVLFVRFVVLGDRPRMGFEGVAETVFGIVIGALLFGIAGFVLAGRVDPGRRWIALLVIIALVVGEWLLVRLLLGR